MTKRTPIMTTTHVALATLFLGALLLAGPAACDKPANTPDATGASDTGEAKAPGTSAKRFTHEALEFSLAFPDTWTVQKDFKTFALMGVSPQEGEEDRYGENVNVMAMTTPKDITLEAFASFQIEQAREMLDGYARRGSSFEEINGHKAARFDYVHSLEDLRIVSITFILLKDDISYAITCSTTLEDYDRYRATLNEIARSFRFTGR